MSIEKHIFRRKIVPDQYYPLKYSDVESCFLDFESAPIYLSIYFGGYEVYDREARVKIRAEGRAILRGQFKRAFNSSKVATLSDDAPAIELTVHAFPRDLAKEIQVNRRVLRDALDRLIHLVMPRGLSPNSWWFSIDFVPDDEPGLNCRYKRWNGLREGEEKSFRLPIKPEEVDGP
jgi:hypothetical protein